MNRQIVDCPHVSGWRILPALLLCLVIGRVQASGLDPADGPHVELKLALEEDALRMEVTMNIVFLDHIISFPRESVDRIDPIEGPELLDALQAWSDQELLAKVDGIDVIPVVDSLMISDPGTDLLPLFPRTGMRGIRKVRFMVTWSLKSAPQEIELEWVAYPPDVAIDPDDPPPMRIAAEAAVEGIREAIFFTVDSPVWLWRSGSTSIEERLASIPIPEEAPPWSLPLVSLGVLVFFMALGLANLASKKPASSQYGLAYLALGSVCAWLLGGVAVVEYRPNSRNALELPDREAAEALFVPLHSNIYRAFDYVSESDIYDALERSVSGELLDVLYRSIYESLVIEEEQGALSRVIAVRPVDLEVETIEVLPSDGEGPRIGFTALYRWQVDGRVTHWGHLHERTNEYLARFDVVGSAAAWRIGALDLLEQERINQFDDPDGVDGGGDGFTSDVFDEDFEF